MRSNVLAVTFCFLFSALAARADNLVTNGGFESGSFTGWTTTDATSGSLYSVGTDLPHSGTYAAQFGGYTPGSYDSIAQTLATNAGTTYLLSFFVAQGDGNVTSTDFQALWNGTVIYDSLGALSNTYAEQDIPLLAAGGDVLTFRGYNVPSSVFLDDVSVASPTVAAAATPEPSSLLLLTTGVAGMAGAMRRRWSAA